MTGNQRNPGTNPPAGRIYSTVRTRVLVVLDQQKLRADAELANRHEMERLQKAEAAISRFETEDSQPFACWMSATFGPTLTKIRELGARISDKTSLVAEVEAEMFWTGERSERAAYARVRMRAENPDLVAAATSSEHPGPKRFREQSAAPPPSHTEEPHPDAARIKDTYRILVRMLHPDMRPADAPDASALWHEVQDAYAAGDLERLQSLAAIAGSRFDTVKTPQAALPQLKALLEKIRHALSLAERKLRSARAEPAWNFAKLRDRTELERRMQTQLNAELSQAIAREKALDARIARWISARTATTKPRRKEMPAQRELW